jgi:hypothetical protein
MDGRDVTEVPIDMTSGLDRSNVVVTFTNAPAAIEGHVQDSIGAAAATANVIAFPVEREQWAASGLFSPRVARATASNDGSYRLPRLPAGTYYLVAVSPDRGDDWAGPDFFERMSRVAARVVVAWGETKAQALKVTDR